MADADTVEIRFSASTDEALAGIDKVQAALAALTEPVTALRAQLDQLGDAIGKALPVGQVEQCAAALGKVGAAAGGSASQLKEISTEMKLQQQYFAARKIQLNAEVAQFQITQNQKYALLKDETQKELDIEIALLQSKLELGKVDADKRKDIEDQIRLLKAKNDTEMLKLDEQSIAAQQAMWNGYLSNVTGAFNSQLRGLLQGTTSWHKAMTEMFADLVTKFIEGSERMVVNWLSAELAKTTATASGTAVREAAEAEASNTGILSMAANALKAIMTDASQAFAGVFAFLAPTMGPAAAGPAAAAQAVVTGIGKFETGTDYVVRGGLALIHPGETIIPAARGSGPYSGGGPRAGDTHMHFNGPFVNGTGERDVRDFARKLARHLNLNPSSRPGY